MDQIGKLFLLFLLGVLVLIIFWDLRKDYLRKKEELGILPLQVNCDHCSKPILIKSRGELKVKNIQATSRYDPPFRAPVVACSVCRAETPIVGEMGQKLLDILTN